MAGGTRCQACQLPHVGIRDCYRDRLVAALGHLRIDAREERTLRWLATILDGQSATVLVGLIGRARADAYGMGRADALAASRGGAVTPSACTDGQAVTKGEAPTSGASPLEAASAIGTPEYQAAMARFERNWCSCGGVCPDCRGLGNG